MSKRILIVEDDGSMARILRDNLIYDGFEVEVAEDGVEALQKTRCFGPDLVLLDVMLPGMDGFEVCRALSERQPQTPIVILTARGQKDDKVHGLELGADDYVTKPFALDELLARIHAVLRRSHPQVAEVVLGDLAVDFRAHRAHRHGVELELTHRELELLQYLAERPGKVVTRDELLRAVWGYYEVPMTRTVDISIARLRRKIEPDPHRPRYLHTVHGEGYCLTPQA